MTNGLKGVGVTANMPKPLIGELAPQLDDAIALGCEYVELPLPALELVLGGRIVEDRLKRVQEIVRSRKLAYTLHGHLGINLMEEPHRIGLHVEVLKANIRIAAALGAEHLVIHSGFVRTQAAEGIELAYDRQRGHLAEAARLAASEGVIVCVENIFEFEGKRHTALPSRLARELASIDHPNLKATFDFSHGWLHCRHQGADFLAEAKALAPWAKHFHCHDSFGIADDFWTFTRTEMAAFGVGDLHLPTGRGNIPWDRMAAECVFPDGIVADCEFMPQHREEWPEALAFTRAWAQSLKTAAPVARAAE